MPTTRRQQAIQEGKIKPNEEQPAAVPQKRGRKDSTSGTEREQPPKKKQQQTKNEAKKPASKKPSSKSAPKSEKPTSKRSDRANGKPPSKAAPKKPASKQGVKEEAGVKAQNGQQTHNDALYKIGTIERGHIYFFYRPKVEHEEAHSIDEVKNFHMLLIPRPPAYAGDDAGKENATKSDPSMTEEAEMKVLLPGADAVPAPVTRRTTKQHYRLLSVGKKRLPDPEEASGKGHRKETFWALVTKIGDDLSELAKGLGPEEYETKTRGTRHQAAARLVARGGYAIVNSEGKTPSQRETHLGYHVSHPVKEDMGEVQSGLGIHSSSSFVVQVKNPLAPSSDPRMSHAKAAEYSESIMKSVFGKGGGKSRESYGLRFASCETPELLDAVGAQLLMIAAREGEQGLELSLGDGRGEALTEAQNEESKMDIDAVFREIGLNTDIFTQEPLEGEWA